MRCFTLVTLMTSSVLLSGCHPDAINDPANAASRQPGALASRGVANFSYAFTRLDVPGASATFPSGINAGGQIVGSYSQGGITRGFIYDDGVYTTVEYPGAAFTQLRGIGPGGEIVGTYGLPGEPSVNIHGFIRTTSGDFIKADYPGHINTIAQRILPDGTILGCYHDNDTMGSMHGMTIGGRAGVSEISAFASMHNGATPGGGKVVGLFTDRTAGKGRAYLIENGVFTPFDVPGSNFTAAWDISPNGTIVGLFRDAAAPNRVHGYVLMRGEFTTIDVPNSVYTDVFGINAGGDIVGKFRETTGPFHGYVATRRAEGGP